MIVLVMHIGLACAMICALYVHVDICAGRAYEFSLHCATHLVCAGLHYGQSGDSQSLFQFVSFTQPRRQALMPELARCDRSQLELVLTLICGKLLRLGKSWISCATGSHTCGS